MNGPNRSIIGAAGGTFQGPSRGELSSGRGPGLGTRSIQGDSNMRLTPSILLTSSVLALSSSCLAGDLVAYEGFNYNPSINLQGASGGSGWSGNWVKNQLVVTGVGTFGLTWPNLQTSGNCAATAAFGGTQYSIYTRLLASYANNGTVYVSFLFQPLFGYGAGGGLEFGPLTGGMIVGAHPGTGYYGLMDTFFAGVDTQVPVEQNVTALCVVKVTNNFDGTVVYSLYMNPTVGGPEPLSAEATYMIGGTMPNLVRILNDGGFLTDEIRVGTTWTSVLPPIAPPACTGDLDHSGTVDASDLAILLGGWGTATADIDGSGMTDAADLGILLGAWGPCN